MARGIEQYLLVFWRSRFRAKHFGIAVLAITCVFPSTTLGRSQSTSEKNQVQLVQQQNVTQSESDRTAAERTSVEAQQLRSQGTRESLRQSIQKYKEALRLWKAVGDRHQESATLNHLGEVYNLLGEQQKALDYFNQALALHRNLGQKNWEAITLSQMGEIYTKLGEKQKALDYFTQALPLYRSPSSAELCKNEWH